MNEKKERPLTLTPRTITLLLGGLVVLYQASFHLWYGGTLLGRYPVLDGREILLLAESMATGKLQEEPFYRAPLYSGILSLFYRMGFSEDGVILMARFINMLAHLGGAAAIGYLSHWFWQDTRAGWAGFALAGFYPVTLHFAGDPLDTVFSLGLFLGALAFLVRSTIHPEKNTAYRLWWLVLATASFVLAIAARPHFLVALPVIMLPIWIFWKKEKHFPLYEALAIILVLGCCFALLGSWNFRVGGEFRILPWQGPSNWYAANQPGAHGKFFTHSIELELNSEHTNPTRRESEWIFRKEMGREGDWTIAEFNDYWKNRNATLLRKQPIALLRQMLQKTSYLLHNTEQYNNKTYAFHAARTPLLHWNPLGWSFLLTFAVALLPLAWQRNPQRVAVLALTFVLLAGGILLYFVSARFRLPLALLLMIPAAGWAMPGICNRLLASRKLLYTTLGGGGVALVVSLFPWPSVHTPDTTIEDRLLLAQAADHLGEDQVALYYAKAVLAAQPNRLAALEIQTNVRLNQFLLALWEEKIRPHEIVRLEKHLTPALAADIPLAHWTLSLIFWQQGQDAKARDIWYDLAEKETLKGRPELGALLLNDLEQRAKWIALTEAYLRKDNVSPSPYLLAGLTLVGHQEGSRRLAQLLPREAIPRLLHIWQSLMTPLARDGNATSTIRIDGNDTNNQ